MDVMSADTPLCFDSKLIPSEVRKIYSSHDLPDGRLSGGNAAVVENGRLWGFHVTDEPSRVSEALINNMPLTGSRDEGKYGELGSGLYISAVPSIWVCRSMKKYDFLSDLDHQERSQLVAAILTDSCLMSPGYITESEKDVLKRELCRFVKDGIPSSVVMAADQPYNVQFWKPSFLEPLGIAASQQPQEIKVVAQGRFAELNRHPSIETISVLRDELQLDGAYMQGGFASLPQFVIWRNEAVVRFGNLWDAGMLECRKHP